MSHFQNGAERARQDIANTVARVANAATFSVYVDGDKEGTFPTKPEAVAKAKQMLKQVERDFFQSSKFTTKNSGDVWTIVEKNDPNSPLCKVEVR